MSESAQTEVLEAVTGNEEDALPVNPFRVDENNKLAVDVFTHSSTSFPGAWPEEQVTHLLEAWLEVVDSLNSSNRRVDLVRRVTGCLRRRQVKVSARMVRKEMKILRTEYRVYQGLCKIGIPTVRADCIDLLDRIFLSRKSETKPSRKSIKEEMAEVTSPGPHMETIKEAEPQEETQDQVEPGEVECRTEKMTEHIDDKSSELSGQYKRSRIQRRQNMRLLMLQQQEALEQLLKVLQSNLEASKTVILLSEISETLKAQTAIQEKMLSAMSALVKAPLAVT